MKHLKRFEGYSIEDRMEFVEFCENNLAYLVDAGFHLDIQDYGDSYKFTIDRRSKDDYKVKYDFTWDSVKDEIIPFVELLSNSYTINSIFTSTRGKGHSQYTIEDILYEKKNIEKINTIVFYINK